MKIKARKADKIDSFMDLVQQFPLRPIRNGHQYDMAAAILDQLALQDAALDAGQADYLQTLELLIDAYDKANAPTPPDDSTPVQRLQFLLNHNQMSPSDLGDLLGSRPLASMVLKGNRELSKAHIRKLADRFKVDAGYFL